MGWSVPKSAKEVKNGKIAVIGKSSPSPSTPHPEMICLSLNISIGHPCRKYRQKKTIWCVGVSRFFRPWSFFSHFLIIGVFR